MCLKHSISNYYFNLGQEKMKKVLETSLGFFLLIRNKKINNPCFFSLKKSFLCVYYDLEKFFSFKPNYQFSAFINKHNSKVHFRK